MSLIQWDLGNIGVSFEKKNSLKILDDILDVSKALLHHLFDDHQHCDIN